ncbi:Os10g0398600, partial [Oryza sativa Japonica Group]
RLSAEGRRLRHGKFAPSPESRRTLSGPSSLGAIGPAIA